MGRRLGCCLYIVRVSLEPQAPAALLLARNITGRLRELCVHRPWTMLSRSSSRRRVASCSYAAFYRENRIIGRNTGRTTGNTRPRFSLPSRTRVIAAEAERSAGQLVSSPGHGICIYRRATIIFPESGAIDTLDKCISGPDAVVDRARALFKM